MPLKVYNSGGTVKVNGNSVPQAGYQPVSDSDVIETNVNSMASVQSQDYGEEVAIVVNSPSQVTVYDGALDSYYNQYNQLYHRLSTPHGNVGVRG